MGLAFDGITSDGVAHGTIAGLVSASAATVMAWFYFTDVSVNDTIFGGPVPFFVIAPASDWRVAAPNGGSPSLASPPLANIWAHVALRFNGAGATNDDRSQIFLDAIKQTAVSFFNAVSASLPGGAPLFEVLGNAQSGGAFAAARAAHLKVWSAALSQAEIAQEMAIGRPQRTANLECWAPYDDGVLARDYSGRGHHGTVVGGTRAAGPPVSVGG